MPEAELLLRGHRSGGNRRRRCGPFARQSPVDLGIPSSADRSTFRIPDESLRSIATIKAAARPHRRTAGFPQPAFPSSPVLGPKADLSDVDRLDLLVTQSGILGSYCQRLHHWLFVQNLCAYRINCQASETNVQERLWSAALTRSEK